VKSVHNIKLNLGSVWIMLFWVFVKIFTVFPQRSQQPLLLWGTQGCVFCLMSCDLGVVSRVARSHVSLRLTLVRRTLRWMLSAHLSALLSVSLSLWGSHRALRVAADTATQNGGQRLLKLNTQPIILPSSCALKHSGRVFNHRSANPHELNIFQGFRNEKEKYWTECDCKNWW